MVYADSFYHSMRQVEATREFLPDVISIEQQQELNSRMRTILVDWLIELHQRFRL